MREDEKAILDQANKYDWSQVPAEVQWIATDPCRYAWGYTSLPLLRENQWRGDLSPSYYASFEPLNNTYHGDWRESLEHRPSQASEQCKGCSIGDEADFAVGDLVILNVGSRVYKIDHIKNQKFWLESDKSFLDVVNISDVLRHAKPAEKAAGYRIDTPTVCTEIEPLDLFNSKHCSPRNYSNDSALRVSEIKASVAYSKMALTNFTLSEKNSRLKTNNHALKAALAVAIVAGVVGWML